MFPVTNGMQKQTQRERFSWLQKSCYNEKGRKGKLTQRSFPLGMRFVCMRGLQTMIKCEGVSDRDNRINKSVILNLRVTTPFGG